MFDHQASDGKVHVAYFDVPTQASFVWNGSLGRKVDVCIGGYGEPVDHRIELSVFKGQFEATCIVHASTLPVFACGETLPVAGEKCRMLLGHTGRHSIKKADREYR